MSLRGIKVTILDVARRAGVSGSTVSYVLNNGPKTISGETAERVRIAARELGYSSNLLAKSLVTGKAWAVGVLVYRLEAAWSAQQLAGIEDAAQDAGYKVVVASHRQDPSRALRILNDMAAWRLDGLISVSTTLNDHPAVQRHLAEQTLPCVFSYHEPPQGFPIDGVTVDQVQGGRLATEHLLSLGRRRIAFLGGPEDHVGVIGRLAGYRQAMAEAGLTPNPAHVRCAENFYVPDGLPVATEMFAPENGPPPDAVFAASDNLAAAVLRVCAARGLSVPGDVAVIGFDDTARDTTFPSMSSVVMPVQEVGKQSMARLIARLEDRESWRPEVIRLPCTLKLRASTVS